MGYSEIIQKSDRGLIVEDTDFPGILKKKKWKFQGSVKQGVIRMMMFRRGGGGGIRSKAVREVLS